MSTPLAGVAAHLATIRHAPGLVGRVVEDLDLQPVARIVQRADRVDQPLGHVHLVVERQLHGQPRQPVEPVTASRRRRPGASGRGTAGTSGAARTGPAPPWCRSTHTVRTPRGRCPARCPPPLAPDSGRGILFSDVRRPQPRGEAGAGRLSLTPCFRSVSRATGPPTPLFHGSWPDRRWSTRWSPGCPAGIAIRRYC